MAEHPDQPTGSRKSPDSPPPEQTISIGASAAPNPNHGPLPNIEGYRVLGALGEGGMGVVWKALQLSTKRVVALKFMSAGALGSERERLRFQREVELTARLDHPHIARIYDSGLRQGMFYYAMELVEGKDLARHIADLGLGRDQIIGLMQLVCRAVQHAHQNGVIHRDLKPSNILVDGQGQPRVLDFGLAKALEGSGQVSLNGVVAGTPIYMSPEQAGGRSRQLDTRSDVYTLGVILFQLLTRNFPHDTSGSALQVMLRISEQAPKRLIAVDPAADRDLDALVNRALEHDPERRYASAGELADDLQRYLAHEPLVARAPTFSYLLRKQWQRHRMRASAAAAVIALLLGIAIYSYFKIAQARDVAIGANAEKDRQRQIAEDRQSEAEASAKTARRRLADLYVRQGWSAVDAGDPSIALLYFLQELQTVCGEPRAELAARTRIGTTLRMAPRLPQLLRRDTDATPAIAPLVIHGGSVLMLAGTEVRVLESASGRAMIPPLKHDQAVYFCAFSPNGKRIATLSIDKAARVWDAASGKLISPPLRHDSPVRFAVFSPDATRLATVSQDRTARIWNATTGQALGKPLYHAQAIFFAAFSPDGARIATTSGDNSARVWDASTGQPLTGPLIHKKLTIFAAFSPRGDRLVTTSLDQTARVWEAVGGKPLTGPLRHGGYLTSAAFAPDGDRVVTGADDGTARVWDVRSGEPTTAILRQERLVSDVRFSPDGEQVIVTGGDRIERVWSAYDRRVSLELEHGDTVNSAVFSLDGRRIATGSNDGTARIWDAASGRPLTPPLRHDKGVMDVAWSRDGAKVATASLDQTARVWDSASGKLLFPPLAHEGRINRVMFTPDGAHLVTASFDGTARIWDAITGKPVGEPLRHGGTVDGLDISADGMQIVTAGQDKTAKIWDAASGQLIRTFPNQSAVYVARFNPDGKRVLLAAGKMARIWTIQDGQPACPPMMHDNTITAAAFDAKGMRVVTGSFDRTARVWDAASGQPLTGPIPHGNAVKAAAFSPDGERIVTGSDDGTARVWDSSTGQAITPPLRHDRDIHTVAFSPDGKSVLTGGFDGRARLWDLSPELRSTDDLKVLTELLSASLIDSTGAPATIKEKDWASLRRKLEKSDPAEFVDPGADLAQAASELAAQTFWFSYGFQPPGIRHWSRVDPMHWQETYPGGVNRFELVGVLRQGMEKGALVRRLPEKDLELLIPLKEGSTLQFRRVGEENWKVIGQIHIE